MDTLPARQNVKTMSGGDDLFTCARCGDALTEEEVALIVYEADERDFNPDDPGPVRERYCEKCLEVIEKAHERHDQEVSAFREELEHLDELTT
jgi:hypothetical protein